MDDLVQRLRSGGAVEHDPRMLEAADEIERLRAALQDISGGLGEMSLNTIGRFAPVVARKALEQGESD